MNEPRLFPRWWVTTVVLVLLVTIGSGAIGFFAADGLLRIALTGLGLGTLVLLVAVAWSLLVPRRRKELEPDAAGTVVVHSPPLIVWPAVLACVLIYLCAVSLALMLVVDPADIESPGAAVVAAIGVVLGAPDMFRLVTGRLHRWRLVLTPEGLTYRGYRTDETVPWSKVHGASVQRGKDAGVLIDRKGSGRDLVVPMTAFDVPAEQIVEEIELRTDRRRR